MEIKILGICGSPIKGGNTEVLLRKSLEAAGSTSDVKTRLITLAGKNINDCKHCNWCTRKQEEGKFCAQQDDMNEIYSELLEADAFLWASPVYIARLSGYMACFMDRLRVFGMGNLYRHGLRNKVAGALAVSWGRNLGIETTLLSIVSGFLLMEMVPVGPPHGWGSPLGAAAVARVARKETREHEDKHGVLHDEYGIKGAQVLGKRVAEIAKLIKAGESVIGRTS